MDSWSILEKLMWENEKVLLPFLTQRIKFDNALKSETFIRSHTRVHIRNLKLAILL